jgi:hypothetical protein
LLGHLANFLQRPREEAFTYLQASFLGPKPITRSTSTMSRITFARDRSAL